MPLHRVRQSCLVVLLLQEQRRDLFQESQCQAIWVHEQLLLRSELLEPYQRGLQLVCQLLLQIALDQVEVANEGVSVRHT
jgi:dimeric dUTPase (all-alpha-NTP-PPase superfamily)